MGTERFNQMVLTIDLQQEQAVAIDAKFPTVAFAQVDQLFKRVKSHTTEPPILP